jgi:hypothetical protein
MKGPPLPGVRCPQCGELADAYTSMCNPDHTPDEGDVSMCWSCGQILRFNGDLSLRKITEDELRAIPAGMRLLLLRLSDERKKYARRS